MRNISQLPAGALVTIQGNELKDLKFIREREGENLRGRTTKTYWQWSLDGLTFITDDMSTQHKLVLFKRFHRPSYKAQFERTDFDSPVLGDDGDVTGETIVKRTLRLIQLKY